MGDHRASAPGLSSVVYPPFPLMRLPLRAAPRAEDHSCGCSAPRGVRPADGLCLSFQPVPEELQNGEGFGYVVAFRPLGATSWIQTVVPSADTPRYVFRNESILPFSLYEVRVGVYNDKGEGPFSPVTTVFSAEEGRGRPPAPPAGPRACP